jgi:hypothetical protein
MSDEQSKADARSSDSDPGSEELSAQLEAARQNERYETNWIRRHKFAAIALAALALMAVLAVLSLLRAGADPEREALGTMSENVIQAVQPNG